LTDLCSYRLIVTLFPNRSEIQFVQGVQHGDLKSFHYKMVGMNKLTPNIQEVMAFPNWLSVKQNLQKLLSLGSVLHRPIWTLETKTFLAPKFF
jgi:hypothetical protein